MKNCCFFFLWLALIFPLSGRTGAAVQDPAIETPQQLWRQFQKELPPLSFTIEKDQVIRSETDPNKSLRRLDFCFSSQKVPVEADIGADKWIFKDLIHRGVIFIPFPYEKSSELLNKVVIVGSLVGPFFQSFLSNYGDPIATRTGYPTMVLPAPGELKGQPGREYSQGVLIKYRREHPHLFFHSHFRWAVTFLLAMDVMAEVLEKDKKEIRAVIGGHSKRATSAYTAAAIDPERISGVVFMGNESLHPEDASSPWWVVSPFYAQNFVRSPVFYVGATNEGGYAMFNINKIVSFMQSPWTLEIIPNYRHASESEKQFLAWQIWVAHIFDGRPITKITDLKWQTREEGTDFFARINSLNKLILVKAWYVYCDDVPLWRDLVWYPLVLRKSKEDRYTGYLPGRTPDAWLVEVLDTAQGFRGYVSSLPQNITQKPVAVRKGGGGFPRSWKKK